MDQASRLVFRLRPTLISKNHFDDTVSKLEVKNESNELFGHSATILVSFVSILELEKPKNEFFRNLASSADVPYLKNINNYFEFSEFQLCNPLNPTNSFNYLKIDITFEIANEFGKLSPCPCLSNETASLAESTSRLGLACNFSSENLLREYQLTSQN